MGGVLPKRFQHMGENNARPQSTCLSVEQLIIIIIIKFQLTLYCCSL